jgi:dTDP-D-glucose 4,6-dehydratase
MDPTKPGGQLRRCLDVSRAEREFYFKATTDFDEGLQRTIQWYLEQAGSGRAGCAGEHRWGTGISGFGSDVYRR